MTKVRVAGIDPGVDGSPAIIKGNDEYEYGTKLTQPQIAELIRWEDVDIDKCYLEKWHVLSMYLNLNLNQATAQRQKSFKLNVTMAICGILDSLMIAYDTVSPQKWQGAMDCLTGEIRK